MTETSRPPRSLWRMADKRTEAALRDWRKREERFSEALAAFTASGESGKLSKKTAIKLSGLRAQATSAMEAYFKRALK